VLLDSPGSPPRPARPSPSLALPARTATAPGALFKNFTFAYLPRPRRRGNTAEHRFFGTKKHFRPERCLASVDRGSFAHGGALFRGPLIGQPFSFQLHGGYMKRTLTQ